jgi:hypothetical protein
VERERPWSLSEWLYWFERENRQWCWWDAKVLNADLLAFAAEVESWPFP